MNSSITTTSSLSVSPCILNIETRLNLPGALSGAGYLSVFDVIRQSQSQFVRRNKGLLKEQSEQAYCLALGLANQVRRAFRKNQLTASVQKALPRTLSGQRAVAPLAGGAQQGLMTGGPSWQTQFSDDLTAYCQSGAPEADDSPVAYLSWLYDQARSFEQSASEAGLNIIKLEDRRPDLPELMVNDEAINQVVPSLQLVNQILEAAITPSITGSTVDETLAVTRYPSVLPYHAPHDQVELSLDNAGVPLSGVIGQTDISWPYFVSATLGGNNSEQACALGSQLAPGQQTILTEATNAPSKAFYKANFGYDTDSYTPFADPDLLAYQAGITIPQLEQLIASNCGGPGTSVVASPNVPTVSADASQYGAVFVNSGSTPAIDLEVARHGYVDVISGNDTNRLFLATNATPTAGLYNAGLTTYIQPNSYAYFDGNSDVATLMRGDKDFTLSFWLYRLSLTDYQMPIFSNSGSCAQLSYSPGFSLSTYGNTSKAGVALNISDDTDKDHSTSGWDTSVEINQWTYIAMVWTASTRIADVYVVKDGNSAEGANITVDASTLGNIYTADNFTWAFNALGDLDTSDFSPNGTRLFIYDEIAVFAGCLTADQISDITTSNKPLSDLIDSPDITSSPWIAPSHYYPLDSGLHNLSDANMDRINRMVRLQRWLDLPYEQVDLLLSACARAQGQNNTDFSSNTHTLRMLGVFRQFQKKYQTTAYEFAAIINQITPYAISPNVPFFDQVFNSPSLFETPFAITDENFSYPPGTADDERIVKQICTGLKISEAQFGALAGHVMAKQGDSTDKTLKCSLDVVSAFYRLAMLPRWMGLSFAEGVALFSLLADGQMAWNTLASVPQLASLDGSPPQPKDSDILDVLMALDSAADWAKSHSQSWIKNYLILQDTLEHPVPNTNVLNVVTSINQQLPAALLTEADFDGVEAPLISNLALTGYAQIQGATDIQAYQFDSTNSQCAWFSDYPNTLTNGSTSYSIGCWMLISSSDLTTTTPILSNYNYKNGNGGVLITPQSNNHLGLGVYDATASKVEDANTVSYPPDEWFYFTLTLDVETKTATIYAHLSDGTSTTIGKGYSTLTETIIAGAGCSWHLNENGSRDYYTTYSYQHGCFAYDDLSVWDRVLSPDEIKAIVASALPATQTVPATVVMQPESWMSALCGLVDAPGLVLPVSPANDNSVYDTINASVTTIVDAMTFDPSCTQTKEQIASSVTTVIYQALLTQNGIADSALAQLLGTPQSLSTFLLQWATDSEYRLLSDTLKLNGITAPAGIPDAYLRALYQLGRRASVVTQYHLTPATLNCFLAHPDWFGVTDPALTLTLLYRLSRYADWLTLSGKEDAVLAYLNWVNDDTSPNPDPDPDPATAATALADLLDWDKTEVQDAAGQFGTASLALTVRDVDGVMRLQTLSEETGLSVKPLLSIGKLTLSSTYSDWQAAGESLVAAQSAQQ